MAKNLCWTHFQSWKPVKYTLELTYLCSVSEYMYCASFGDHCMNNNNNMFCFVLFCIALCHNILAKFKIIFWDAESVNWIKDWRFLIISSFIVCLLHLIPKREKKNSFLIIYSLKCNNLLHLWKNFSFQLSNHLQIC